MRDRGLPKLICLLVVLSLSAFICGGVALAGFSDVSDTHWAAKNIEKMSARGVIGGYPDGTFQPNKTVSQVEAVCMAVRALGLQASPTENLPALSFPVPKWAEPDVKLAVKHGLLKSDDQFSAYAGASRAWVARLLVRMIGKESEAEERLLMPNFTDTFKIPDWAVYYVRVAQDNDLVAGYSDNTFKPDRPVTRAELVAFLSRVDEHRTGGDSNYITGSISSVDSTQVSITTDDGRNLAFNIPYDLPVYKDNERISVAELQRFDRVKLLADGFTLKYLEVISGQAGSSVVSGIVKKVYPELNAVVIEVATGELRTLYLPSNALTTVVGSSASGLNALQPGDQVEVTLDAAGFISGIVVNSRSGAANAGIVYDLDQEAGLLTLQWDNDRLTSYPLADMVSVQVSGLRFATMNDIHNGDRVRVSLENGRVTGIELLDAAARLTVTGEVVILDTSRAVINLEVDGELQVYRLSSDVDVTIPGLTGALLSDVDEGDTVTADIQDGQVVSLAVEGRQSGDMFTATVLAVDTGNQILTLKNSSGNLMAYDVRSEARIMLNDEEVDLDNLEQDMEVRFRLLDDEIIYVEVDNTTDGTVVSIDEDSLLLVLELDSGQRKTYIVDKYVDINSEDSRNEVDEISRGDYAKILVEDDKVTEINLRTVLIYRVTDIKESFDRLYVEDEDGDSERLYIRDGVELVVPGISDPELEDIEEGDLVKATYIGRELKTVEVTSAAMGEVISINTYSGSVNLKLFDGGTSTVAFDSGSRVEAGGRSYTSLSALAIGDRVEVLQNMDGGNTFKVMEKLSGRLAVDGNFSASYVYLDSGSWAPYNVDEDVYVHDTYGALTSKAALRQGDSVDLYLLNDVVYEIVKK